MIIIKQKKECCGCSACSQICPIHCITMELDEEGFLYPTVDHSKCINCGKCERACPVLNCKKETEKELSTFVAHSREQGLLENSSSGGIFGLLARKEIEQGGCVCGAVFDKDYSVMHVCIENNADIEQLQKSKYVQSKLNGIFREIENKLQRNTKVMFSGTPCQVAALRNYLQKDYENLTCISILCHGVPSPKLWKYYLNEITQNNKKRIQNINFRDKNPSWKEYSITIVFSDGSKFSEPYSTNKYFVLFLENMSLRPACYDCKFKDIPHVSDITLGDAWGYSKAHEHGESIVICNTEKGEQLFESISNSMTVAAIDNLNEVLSPRADSRKSVQCHPNRKRLFKLLNEEVPFEVLFQCHKLNSFQKLLIKTRRIKRGVVSIVKNVFNSVLSAH